MLRLFSMTNWTNRSILSECVPESLVCRRSEVQSLFRRIWFPFHFGHSLHPRWNYHSWNNFYCVSRNTHWHDNHSCFSCHSRIKSFRLRKMASLRHKICNSNLILHPFLALTFLPWQICKYWLHTNKLNWVCKNLVYLRENHQLLTLTWFYF